MRASILGVFFTRGTQAASVSPVRVVDAVHRVSRGQMTSRQGWFAMTFADMTDDLNRRRSAMIARIATMPTMTCAMDAGGPLMWKCLWWFMLHEWQAFSHDCMGSCSEFLAGVSYWAV